MTPQRNRATHKMADMRYYGNVMTTKKVDKQVQSTTVLLKM